MTTRIYRQEFHIGRERLESDELATVGHGVPRVTKLLALAFEFRLVGSDSVVANYAELV